MNPEKLSPIRIALTDINQFCDQLIQLPLLTYQRPIADAISKAVLSKKGGVITCEMPRQSGKNQVAASCEMFLLVRHYASGGNLIKTAPTFQPQLTISKNRITGLLDKCPLTKSRWKLKDGNTITLGRARETFLSAQPGANVVGATADIALFVDEGQEIDSEKFERDFSPMRAWKDAPMVVFGVRWDGESFLERLIEENLDKENHDGIRRHFRVEPDQVIAVNPAYERHFEREVARLGSDHILIKTQYLLESVSALGDMFTPAQIVAMQGGFSRRDMPYDGCNYYIGIDIGGESLGEESHDESVMVVVERSKSTQDENLRIVNCYRWSGANWEKLHRELMTLLDHWRPKSVVIDGRGIGNACALSICEKYKSGDVEAYQGTSSTVSDDGFYLMSTAGLGNMKIFNEPDSKPGSSVVSTKDIFYQLNHARRELASGGNMRFYVPERYGHDDILKAISYAIRATRNKKHTIEKVLLEAVIDL